MPEPSPDSKAAEDLPTASPHVQAGRLRSVQAFGAGMVVIAALLFARAFAPSNDSAWEGAAALFGPPTLCLGITWINMGRVSPISCLAACVGLVLSFLATCSVAIKYSSV